MTERTFVEQVISLRTVLESMEVRMGSGDIPREAVADFKSVVDDLRLRLWSVLGDGSPSDYRAFQEHFRLRRAKEICRGLEDDLRAGALNPHHEALPALGQAARSLAARIEALASAAPGAA